MTTQNGIVKAVVYKEDTLGFLRGSTDSMVISMSIEVLYGSERTIDEGVIYNVNEGDYRSATLKDFDDFKNKPMEWLERTH